MIRLLLQNFLSRLFGMATCVRNLRTFTIMYMLNFKFYLNYNSYISNCAKAIGNVINPFNHRLKSRIEDCTGVFMFY